MSQREQRAPWAWGGVTTGHERQGPKECPASLPPAEWQCQGQVQPEGGLPLTAWPTDQGAWGPRPLPSPW